MRPVCAVHPTTLAPAERSVVVASNDPSLQVGPTAQHCERGRGPVPPPTIHVCHELYLYDLETAETQQLTGLDGSSAHSHLSPVFTDDGTAIDDGRFIVLSRWVTPQTRPFRLVDTDTGAMRPVASRWINQDASRFAVVQSNVAPDATDHLILAPLPD